MFLDKDIIGKYGDVYVSTADTSEFIKQFVLKLTYKMQHFGFISFNEVCNQRKKPPKNKIYTEKKNKWETRKEADKYRSKTRKRLIEETNQIQNKINETKD